MKILLTLIIALSLSVFIACIDTCIITNTCEDVQIVIPDAIKRPDGSVYVENDDYMIDWRFETTGYSPVTGMFYLEGTKMKSKLIDRSVDICIVTPEPFLAGSTGMIYWQDYGIVKTPWHYYCN